MWPRFGMDFAHGETDLLGEGIREFVVNVVQEGRPFQLIDFLHIPRT